MGKWAYLFLTFVCFDIPAKRKDSPALLSKVRFLWLRILIKNHYFWQQKGDEREGRTRGADFCFVLF